MARQTVLALGIAATLAWPVQTGTADDHAAVPADVHAGDDHGHAAPAPAKKPQTPKTDAHAPASEHAAPTEKTPSKPADKPQNTDSKHATKAQPPTTPANGEVKMDGKGETVAKGKSASESEEPVNADQAIVLLKEGNARWVSGKPEAPHTDANRLKMLAEKGQKPFVTVLTCADSRIPLERVFDQGVGDVFGVRVAGNVAGVSETGTIEYGVGHLKTPLLVVMGHTKCGAVAAAATNAALHGSVATLVDGIKPAVERAKRNNPGVEGADLTPYAVRENVWQTVFDLYRSSDELRQMVSKGELKVIGAVYDIATGKVDFLGEHPWQSELIEAITARASNAPATAHGSTTE